MNEKLYNVVEALYLLQNVIDYTNDEKLKNDSIFFQHKLIHKKAWYHNNPKEIALIRDGEIAKLLFLGIILKDDKL